MHSPAEKAVKQVHTHRKEQKNETKHGGNKAQTQVE
jgi:hypothetical protein